MAATTPRKRATTRKTAVKPVEDNVIRLDRDENVAAIQALIDDREPLFSIGGQTYTIPKKAPAAWAIMTTNLAVETGDTAAVEYALHKMLGEEGYEALSKCEFLTQEDFFAIRDAVLNRVVPQGPKAS